MISIDIKYHLYIDTHIMAFPHSSPFPLSAFWTSPEDGPGAIAWVHQGKEESFLVPRTGDVFGMKIAKQYGTYV